MKIDFDAKAETWDAHKGHAARTAAIAGGIASRIPLAKTMRALEIGAGTGLLGLALEDKVGSLLFTDPSAGMIEVLNRKLAEHGGAPPEGSGSRLDGAEHRLEARVLDLAADPPPQGPFDLVFSQMALHHVPDVPGHLGILRELMAPGGWLCIADLDKEDGAFHGQDFHGHKGFERDALRSQAIAAGFEQVEIDTVFHLPREIDGVVRHFPIFLLTARRA